MQKLTDNCDNFLKPNCDSRIKGNYMFREMKPGQPISYIDTSHETLQKESEICANCPFFMQRDSHN